MQGLGWGEGEDSAIKKIKCLAFRSRGEGCHSPGVVTPYHPYLQFQGINALFRPLQACRWQIRHAGKSPICNIITFRKEKKTEDWTRNSGRFWRYGILDRFSEEYRLLANPLLSNCSP